MNICDKCAYYLFDEEREEYYCDVNLDEDEMARFLSGSIASCPYFDPYDEYKTVRKQN